MNTFFLFTRDSGLLLSVFDEPMMLFSGARVPLESFPLWARAIGSVFPLSYCLLIIRAFFAGGSAGYLLAAGAKLLLCLALMVALAWFNILQAEKHNRKTGQLNLF